MKFILGFKLSPLFTSPCYIYHLQAGMNVTTDKDTALSVVVIL